MDTTPDTIHILHVDDDPNMTELTATVLEEEDGRFDVETATGAAEALASLEETAVDCVISDYEMPGQNGIEFLESVREEFPDLPFILFTGKGSEEVASDAISAGVTDYLQKTGSRGQYAILANRILNAVDAYLSRQLLTKRTRRLETLISNLPGMVYRCRNEPVWPMETVEGEVEALTGYRTEALERDDVKWGEDILHPEDREEMWETVQESLSEDGTFEVTYRIVTRDGTTKWMWEQGRGIYGDDGTVEALEGFITDITDRKRHEDRLAQTSSRLEALFENSPDMINIHDSSGNIIETNSRLCEQTGYDESELTSMTVWDLDETVDPESAKSFWDEMDLGDSRRVEGKFRRKDGSTFPVEVHIRRIDIDGEDRFVAISRDITEQSERERELARYSDTLEDLQRTTQRLMETTDVDEATDIVLQSIENVLDFDVAGVWRSDDSHDRLEPVALSETSEELVPEPPTYSATEDSLSWEAFAEDSIRVIDNLHDHDERYNPDTPIRSELIVPLDEYGLLNIGATETGTFSEQDVALVELWAETVTIAFDRIERERALRDREDELVRERDRLDEFASIVSHDLRNPLNVAELRLDLAREECDSDHLDEVASSHDRIDDLLDSLLTLARHGDHVTETEPVALGDLVRSSWQNVDTAGAEIRVVSDLTLRADRSRLQQVVENLVRNAVEHGSTSSRTASDDAVEHGSTSPDSDARQDAGSGASEPSVADAPEDAVEHGTTGTDQPEDESVLRVEVGTIPGGFYVADDGPGVPEEDRDAVFDAGFSTAEDGTGFGLSIVQEVIDAHGWSADLTESADGGARFEITGVDIVEQ
jgi:PAS domain S-box-containing protein